MLKVAFSIAVLMLAAGCASKSKPVALKPEIKSIAIISATTPAAFSLGNANAVEFLFPVAGTLFYLDGRAKSKVFNEKFLAEPSTLAANFSEQVASALRGYGYQVQILEGLARVPGDLDDVDYDTISTDANAVLHLQFRDVGLYSPRSSTSYLPRVNARGTLFIKGRDDYLYDQDVYYGVDARPGNSWAIAADEKDAYPTFDAVVANLDDVRRTFAAGATEISRRMSAQIHDSIK